MSHKTYLLTWNPGKFVWKGFEEDWEAVFLGHRPRIEWSCGNTQRIEVGDRVFMMQVGYRNKKTGMVASGWVTGEAVEGRHWNDESNSPTALFIEFEPDVLLNPTFQPLLDPTVIETDFTWYPQRSGVTIPDDTANKLEARWAEHLQNVVDPLHKIMKMKDEPTSFVYERDEYLRATCLAHYGAVCAVCGFDFTMMYGEVGAGFMHVHHLIPLAYRDDDGIPLDPIADLRPVCPNCHAMLHRRSPPYAIDELKMIIRKATKAQ